MNKKTMLNKISRAFKFLYLKLFRINDTPHRIALGFGLGAFVGLLPGTGPIAALILATLLKINKVAALLGSILTNTWVSLLTIVLSIKLGAGIMGLEWQEVYSQWQQIITDFRWKQLLNASIIELILPVLTGYLILSLFLAITVYACSFFVLTLLKRRRHENKNRTHIPG